MIAIPIWLLAGLILLTVILGVMLWTNLRERNFKVRIPDADSFEDALPSIAGMTRAHIIPGNSADILQNGDEFFPALLESIRTARQSARTRCPALPANL